MTGSFAVTPMLVPISCVPREVFVPSCSMTSFPCHSVSTACGSTFWRFRRAKGLGLRV